MQILFFQLWNIISSPPVVAALISAIVTSGILYWWKEYRLAAAIEQRNVIAEITEMLQIHKELYDVDNRRLSGIHVPTPDEIKDIENKIRSLAGRLEASIYNTRWFSGLNWSRGQSSRRRNKEDRWKTASEYLYKWSNNIRYLRPGENPFEIQHIIANSLEMTYKRPNLGENHNKKEEDSDYYFLAQDYDDKYRSESIQTQASSQNTQVESKN